MKQSDRDREAAASACRRTAVNVFGILLAFGAAFGGVFLVQECLARETEGLMQKGGEIPVPVHSGTAQASGEPGAGREEAAKKLTEEELLMAVDGLMGTEESYPHEPLQGQLSMVQAIESGREWLEGFFMPHLGMTGTGLQEYRVNCYLWARQAENGAGGDEGEDSLLSYWTVGLSSQELEAGLVLNAVSGQVLEASVMVRSSVEYQMQESLTELLLEYAESFGTTAEYLLIDERGGSIYQDIGDNGLYAVLKTGDIVISSADDEKIIVAPSIRGGTDLNYTEFCYLQLSLERKDTVSVIVVPAE